MRFEGLSLLIDDLALSIKEICFWVISEMFSDLLQCSRKVRISTVENRDDVSGRFVESFVNRLRGILKSLLTPPVQAVVIRFEDSFCFFVMAPIGDQIFEIRVILIENRADRLVQQVRTIKGGSNNCDAGQIAHSVRSSKSLLVAVVELSGEKLLLVKT